MPPNAADHPEIIAEQVSQPKLAREFSRAEVLQHHDREDCYLIIRGKVYAASEFLSEHPGGDILLTYAGDDATDVFAAFHSPNAYAMLSKFQVGELKESEKVESDFLREARKLRALFKEQGLFKSNKLYYTFKVFSNLSMLAASLAILVNFPGSTLGVIAAGLLVALFWQQCGWLSHDFLHNQVFENRNLNNLMGYFLGNVCQGFTVDWWKNKHNTHHAVPNVHGGDPDIDTLPFLAWSEHALEGFSDPEFKKTVPKFLIDNQLYFYAPLLTFARFSWALQSALHLRRTDKKIHNFHIELVSLILHYTWFLSVIFFLCHGIAHKLLFLFVSQLGCGVLLAAVFSLNHNGMPVYTKEQSKTMDFYSLQILTGRAVSNTSLITWFTGGLNYQIEHHLFPMIPRHNFHKIQPLVESLCKAHNIHYHKTGFIDGTIEVLKRLHVVGSASQSL